jgi:guanine deaminase
VTVDETRKGVAVYAGHLISPIDAESYLDMRRGAIAVDQSGTIREVGPVDQVCPSWSGASFYDFGDRLILPGMIDLHIHLPQFTQIGKSGQTLLSWLERYIFPAEARFADTDHAGKIARWFFTELARNGTTLANVFTTIHGPSTDQAFAVAAQMGSRAIMGKVLMDRNAPANLTEDTDSSLRQSGELCEKWHGYDNGRLLYAFVPRFAITCSSNQMEGVARLWHEHKGTYMHTHLAESMEEVEFVQTLFPKSRSYTDVYARHGLLGDHSIFAHSIYLDQQDMSELSQTRSSIAHCPSSNFFLKSGRFNYYPVRESGIRFGLGSDVAGGPYMSLFQVMRDANYMQTDCWIAAPELFYRATLGGAEAVGLEEKLGSLAKGKEADFIVVNTRRKTEIAADMLMQPTEEILSTLVFTGDDRLVEATFVRGRCIFEVEPNLVSGVEQKLSGAPR